MILAELDLSGFSLAELSRRWDSLSGPEAQSMVARHATEFSDTNLCNSAEELGLEEVLRMASPVAAQGIVDELVQSSVINP